MCVFSKSYEEERRLRSDLELRTQRLTLELADTKQHIQDGDFRRENYPKIKRCVFCAALNPTTHQMSFRVTYLLFSCDVIEWKIISKNLVLFLITLL